MNHSIFMNTGRRRLRVAVAMSGGVDSSVAAWMLAKQGHEVVGMYMRNWDERDEQGKCPADRDWADVQRVCTQLPRGAGLAATHPPPVDIDLVREYWHDVFSPFLEGYSAGLTPNPDVACNRAIKFGAFRERALAHGVDAIATGHYARVVHVDKPAATTALASTTDTGWARGGGEQLGESSQLWTARDMEKDQSYFLSHVRAEQLASIMFPLGNLDSKRVTVRRLAMEAGLEAIAAKPESMGICFIGKRRKFRHFLEGYIHTTPGQFVALDDWNAALSATATERGGGGGGGGSDGGSTSPPLALRSLGRHEGLETYTIGQGARIAGRSGTDHGCIDSEQHKRGSARWFVCGKYSATGTVVVAQGSQHPALYCDDLVVRAHEFNWTTGAPPPLLPMATITPECGGGICIDDDGGGGHECGEWGKQQLRCLYRVRHRQQLAPCTVTVLHRRERRGYAEVIDQVSPVSLSSPSLRSAGSDYSAVGNDDSLLVVRFDEPMRGIAPGQHLALYLPHAAPAVKASASRGKGLFCGEGGLMDGFLCLGGGTIASAGPSYWAMNKNLPKDLRSWAV